MVSLAAVVRSATYAPSACSSSFVPPRVTTNVETDAGDGGSISAAPGGAALTGITTSSETTLRPARGTTIWGAGALTTGVGRPSRRAARTITPSAGIFTAVHPSRKTSTTSRASPVALVGPTRSV